jgi:hypothetical protein
MPDTADLNLSVFGKTALGQQEIQSRSLNLSPLVRRVLVLVDGKRSGAELSVFLVGKGDIDLVLGQLLECGCIEVVSTARPAPVPAVSVTAEVAPSDSAPADGALDGLPPVESRSAKDNEMARNFMINSVNAIIGQNMRVTLVTDIFNAKSTEQLRQVYHAWASSMSGHGTGAKRLPELREKLFKVL